MSGNDRKRRSDPAGDSAKWPAMRGAIDFGLCMGTMLLVLHATDRLLPASWCGNGPRPLGLLFLPPLALGGGLARYRAVSAGLRAYTIGAIALSTGLADLAVRWALQCTSLAGTESFKRNLVMALIVILLVLPPVLLRLRVWPDPEREDEREAR